MSAIDRFRFEPGLAPLATQVRRFVLTGSSMAIVDFGLYSLLLSIGLHVNIAKATSLIIATSIAYYINRRWTFAAKPSYVRFLEVIALYTLTFAVQVGINYALYLSLPENVWRVPVGFVIAQGAATSINFTVQRTVIFGRRNAR
ncbi:GtrA family protein [Mycobacteroides salmoniphilum]|nr:GtrA family protein [Mycobacteroides salmoniphilum]